MFHNKPEDGNDEGAPIGGGFLLPDPSERARREQADRDKREDENKKLLLELQTKQANAEIRQADSNAVTAKLTAALVFFTLGGIFVSYLQFQAANTSAKAAKSAAETAAGALELQAASGAQSSGLRTHSGVETKVVFGGQTMVHAKVRFNEAAMPVEVDCLSLMGKGKGSISLGLFRWDADEAVFCIASPSAKTFGF